MADALAKKFVDVLGKSMAYVEAGEGAPIVLLHGNPTSSYLWRNIIPHLAPHGRCLAPDLIGMGDSDKLEDSGPGRYRFVEHRRYLDAFFEALGLDAHVVLVVHDWGSALGFDWANRHRGAVRGIAHMEAIFRAIGWDEFPADFVPTFQALRSDAGEQMILEDNLFVEQILPGAILRELSQEEHDAYRAPFAEPGEGRRPTLTWPRELPLGGEPADVIEIIAQSSAWLAESLVPKFFVNAEPGALVTGATREFCRTWPNQTEITVAGIHFIQEDAPDEIGRDIAAWIQNLPML